MMVASRRNMVEGSHDQDEWHDRAEDDDISEQEPDGRRELVETAQERGARVGAFCWKAPPGLHEGPKDAREEEPVGQKRGRITAPVKASIGHDDVERVG